jgi:hypothetical protein
MISRIIDFSEQNKLAVLVTIGVACRRMVGNGHAAS